MSEIASSKRSLHQAVFVCGGSLPSRFGEGPNDLRSGLIHCVAVGASEPDPAASGLFKKTIQRHVDNLWLLGGEIIRD